MQFDCNGRVQGRRVGQNFTPPIILPLCRFQTSKNHGFRVESIRKPWRSVLCRLLEAELQSELSDAWIIGEAVVRCRTRDATEAVAAQRRSRITEVGLVHNVEVLGT